MEQNLLQGNKVIGKKQTLRSLMKDEVLKVFVSLDADRHVTDEIIEIATKKDVEIIYYENMKELGEACEIHVNAAAAAVLK